MNFNTKANDKFFQEKRNRIIIVCGAILLIIAIVFGILLEKGMLNKFFVPSIILISPEPVAANNREEIVVDVVLSGLPDGVFPTAGLSILFDRKKLEFIGVKEGTMMTLGKSIGDEKTYKTPIWKTDVDISNRLGEIHTTYSDITSGGFAYVRECFRKNHSDILLRFIFRFRDSVQAGENYSILINEAAIRGDEGKTSLTTDLQTLKVYPAKIIAK